jgi:hypothetical protein
MHVRVISFGTNWWVMHSRNLDDSYCFGRNTAWFNSTGLMSGRRLRLCWIYPGQIRFNLTSGFDPEFKSRAMGKTFWCCGPNRFRGKTHLLFVRPAGSTCPDTHLVTLSSGEHGPIQFDKPGWKSRGVEPIAVSLRGRRYEAMMLITAGSWIQSDLGRWMISADGRRLVLSEGEKGVLE